MVKHPDSTSRTPMWDILIPIKGLDGAKSRLAGSVVSGSEHIGLSVSKTDLALAFALDVVVATLECPMITTTFVVTRDETVAAKITELGAEVIIEPESWDAVPELGALSPLNAAIQFGADRIRLQQDQSFNSPDPQHSIAIITGDLPCLDTKSLAQVLTLAWTHDRSFVPDHTGLGTAMLYTKDQSHTPIDPHFGVKSAHAHEASGAVRLEDAPLRARLDVDTAIDLEHARQLGVGVETAKVLRSS